MPASGLDAADAAFGVFAEKQLEESHAGLGGGSGVVAIA
jgi:hypothetical protein